MGVTPDVDEQRESSGGPLAQPLKGASCCKG